MLFSFFDYVIENKDKFNNHFFANSYILHTIIFHYETKTQDTAVKYYLQNNDSLDLFKCVNSDLAIFA
jgi:hypothetical protein